MHRGTALGACATAVALALGACAVREPHVPAWEPGERGTQAWLEYHDALVASVRAAQPRLVFLGDSLCERWRTDGFATWRSDPNLRGAFSLGVGGDTTQNVLWRIAHGTLDGIAPEIVVLLAGTNDIGYDPPRDIERGIVTIAREVRERLPRARLLLLGIFPRGADPGEPIRREVAAINARLLAERLGSKTIVRDIGAAFCDAAGRQRPALYERDRVHLTSAGYARWARELDPLLR